MGSVYYLSQRETIKTHGRSLYFFHDIFLILINTFLDILCCDSRFSFFPDRMQPVVSIMSNVVFTVLVKAKICKKPQRKYDFSSPTTITVTLPGTDPQDAERRRYMTSLVKLV